VTDESRESVVDYAKQQDLLTMYASVDRMNNHMVEGNTDGVVSEQHLQQNIRSNFRELQSRQGIETEL
jgi:hypothetical protein